MFTTDEIIAAANLTASAWLLVLAVVAFMCAGKFPKTEGSDIRLMLFGVGLEALGWALHRGYWGIIRDLRDDKGNEIYLYFSNLWAPQAVIFTIILTGLILVLTPLWRMHLGGSWKWLPAMLVISTFWFFLVTERDFSGLLK